MLTIAAILHTCNDALRIGRALESLHPCDQVLILDHGSHDETARIAKGYGASIHSVSSDEAWTDALRYVSCDWLLFLQATEALTEGAEASLFEWKLYSPEDIAGVMACSLFVREEGPEGWQEPILETRMVPRSWQRWENFLPCYERSSMLLHGDVVRFREP